MNLMSRPVISGFQTAAAITIAMSQMKNIFGCAQQQNTAVELIRHACCWSRGS